jgi:glycerol-3-phosphate dehydrogenase
MASYDAEVVVLGGGVVGCAVAHALAVTGVATVLAEARGGLAEQASGSNSGILHTGFDSHPGELETQLILRSASLREDLLDQLAVPVIRCGARLRAQDATEAQTLARLAGNARRNGVAVEQPEARELLVPGESITDPAAYTWALAERAEAAGAEVRLDTAAAALARDRGGIRVELAGGGSLRARGVANCAGLQADQLARTAGEEPFEIYPRKGEFLVFEQPAEPLREILFPLPSDVGKGVLVFPTLDGHVIAGPTARDRLDKSDWSVEPDAAELILAKARRMFPGIERSEPIASYAGLRPAGRGVNYAIAPSGSLPGLVNVGAIRSTGLTASLGIGEHVAGLLSQAAGLEPAPPRSVPAISRQPARAPWWQLAAERSTVAAGAR